MTDEKKTIITCEKCSANLRVPVGLGNLRITCPACKAQFIYHDFNNNNTEKPKKKKQWVVAFCVVALCLVVFCGTNYMNTGRLFPCSHNWVAATCEFPKTCSKCGATEGSSLGHNWQSADCVTAKQCSRCGKTSGSPLGHKWIAETDSTPKMCSRCGEMVPKSLPSNGEVFIGNNLNRVSTLTINSSSSQSYYIKLKNTSGETVFSFFVRAGRTAVVDVPEGDYQVFFSCGKNWYGTEYLFGDETAYSKDKSVLDFSKYTWEYTLYPVTNGNFTETVISADEF